METSQESRKRRSHKARERAEKRRQRQEFVNDSIPKLPAVNLPPFMQGLWAIIVDNLWQMRQQGIFSNIAKISGVLIAVIMLFFALSIVFSPSIGPNISTMEVDIGGKSIEEATEILFNFWNEDILIDIVLSGDVVAQVRPAEIGLHLDAAATAESAKAAGLSGIPMGHEVEPVITSDYGEAQSYLLAMASEFFVPSYEAGYEWRDGELIAVAGTASQELDISQSVDRIINVPVLTIENRRVELVTISTPPRVIDATPYYEQALAFVNSDFTIKAYDPFKDETQFWTSTKEQMASWLLVTDNGLTIREEGLEPFINYVNTSILFDEVQPRYLDPVETYEAISTAFQNGQSDALLRIRYQNTTYVLRDGDWGQRLSRRTGLPFFNIEAVNPGVDWNLTFVGQSINLPSRDLVLPHPPIPNKRIIVDLDRMWLVAYENGAMVFNWPISIGREDAPTNPGIFQILNKSEVAYGSGFSLCNDNNCGQWEMAHFMGIYDVGAGLTNGFHGSVLLPNGARLDGGSMQIASTYGCVMSDNDDALVLYNWAEVGVIVEIVSAEFPPESQTARNAMELISTLQ